MGLAKGGSLQNAIVVNDKKILNEEGLRTDGINKIDIITGGYPCQPFSVAGKQKGEQDPRHVWPEMFRLIKELKPTWVIGENVSGHIKLGLDTVLENLESEGYSTRTFIVPACGVDAPQRRDRLWIVAHSDNERSQGRLYRGSDTQRKNQHGYSGCGGAMDRQPIQDRWATEPSVGRVAHGISKRVDRLRGLGNAIVPQIAQRIGETILQNNQ
jgi:DNA (cytosine-5)-methyltransferase 1